MQDSLRHRGGFCLQGNVRAVEIVTEIAVGVSNLYRAYMHVLTTQKVNRNEGTHSYSEAESH